MTQGQNKADLARSLTFHASFDNGLNADVGQGDRRLYSATVQESGALAALTEGPGNPALSVVQGAGKYGAALQLTPDNSHVVVYKAEGNVAYSAQSFRGTASFWLRFDPAGIPVRYCDPFQLSDKDYSDACIWLDITKNDTPPDCRLGVFGDQKVWDPTNRRSRGEDFYFRLAKVAEPPFGADRWTHVAITWDGINTSEPGRARLYFDTHYQGATCAIREPFTWDLANATIRLGTGNFVGLYDDLAFFDRPLSPDEIRALHALDGGVSALYR